MEETTKVEEPKPATEEKEAKLFDAVREAAEAWAVHGLEVGSHALLRTAHALRATAKAMDALGRTFVKKETTQAEA